MKIIFQNLMYKNRPCSDNRLVIIQICYQCVIVNFCLTCSFIIKSFNNRYY